MKQDVQIASVKLAPPAAVSVWQQVNDSLPTLILWGTAIYTVLQIYLLARKAWRERNL